MTKLSQSGRGADSGAAAPFQTALRSSLKPVGRRSCGAQTLQTIRFHASFDIRYYFGVLCPFPLPLGVHVSPSEGHPLGNQLVADLGGQHRHSTSFHAANVSWRGSNYWRGWEPRKLATSSRSHPLQNPLRGIHSAEPAG